MRSEAGSQYLVHQCGEEVGRTSAEGRAWLGRVDDNQAGSIDLAVRDGEVESRRHAGTKQEGRPRVCR